MGLVRTSWLPPLPLLAPLLLDGAAVCVWCVCVVCVCVCVCVCVVCVWQAVEQPWKDPSQSQSSQCRLDLLEPCPDPIGVLPLNTGNSDPVEEGGRDGRAVVPYKLRVA